MPSTEVSRPQLDDETAIAIFEFWQADKSLPVKARSTHEQIGARHGVSAFLVWKIISGEWTGGPRWADRMKQAKKDSNRPLEAWDNLARSRPASRQPRHFFGGASCS